MSQSNIAVKRNTVFSPATATRQVAAKTFRPRPVLVSSTPSNARRFSVATREEALRQAILRTG